MADVVDGVVALRGVDEHGSNVVREQGVSNPVDLIEERCLVGRHERQVGGAISDRTEPAGGPSSGSGEQRARVVEPRFGGRSRSIGQDDDAWLDAFEQMMGAKFVTGVSKDQKPGLCGVQKRTSGIRH